MSVAVYNLTILQYATYRMSFALTDESGNPLNITGWTFAAWIKENVAQDLLTVPFTVTILSVPNAHIELDLTSIQTSALTQKKYVYDVLVTDTTQSPVQVYRILEGKVNIDFGVTET